MGRPVLDGALPGDAGSDQEIALAALTRRVAELEHRLDVMKVIVGLVLLGKALIVVGFVYLLLAGLHARDGGEPRSAGRAATLLPGAAPTGPGRLQRPRSTSLSLATVKLSSLAR